MNFNLQCNALSRDMYSLKHLLYHKSGWEPAPKELADIYFICVAQMTSCFSLD